MKILERREVPGLAVLYLAQFGADPKRSVEFVDTLEPGVPKAEKWVFMVSTQVGCPVGCRMCDAGLNGYGGNLTADEILDQVRHVFSENPGLDPARHPKIKIHLARMGEPSLNPHVLEVLRHLGRWTSYRGLIPSISTVAPKSPAVEPFFHDLLAVKDAYFRGGRFQLQFSVHSTDEAKRDEIVPVRKWSLEEIAAYGRRFVRPGDRKVTLNFAPAPEDPLDAAVLERRFPPEQFLVKVTPVNPTLAAGRSRATHLWEEAPAQVAEFTRRLQSAGFEVIVSPSQPEEIAAATSCGQLWSRALGERARVLARNEERQRAAYVNASDLSEKAQGWLRELAPFQGSFPAFDPDGAALLLVDMQEFFLDPASPAFLPEGRAVLGNALRLQDAFRRAGRPVLYTVHALAEGEPEGPMGGRWRLTCRAHSPEARVYRALAPEPREPVFRKSRYSAFTHPGLEPELKRLGISRLVVAGLKTDLCVESTVRDAFDRDFAVFVPADATAASREPSHLASLKSLAHGFARVVASEEIESALAVRETDDLVLR